jgi:predicted HD phosphohydrolase
MKHQVDATLTAALKEAGSAAERAELLMRYMKRRGQTRYDESVTQLEHALQCAFLARQAGAADTTIIAALLHDIGHLITDEEDANGDFLMEDWHHETIGAECLAPFVVEPVIEAMRLHVLAKRYLCSTDRGYVNGLSRASRRSFNLQGGQMSLEELADFERHPYHELAVSVRRWDDGSKVAGWEVPLLETYRRPMEACMLPRNPWQA